MQVKVKDTVGCGDSFAAAIVLGYINGCCEEATLTLANAVGAATATGRGAGRNVAKAYKV
jgi:sugar/nucleoside kinase (ribokinase family)